MKKSISLSLLGLLAVVSSAAAADANRQIRVNGNLSDLETSAGVAVVYTPSSDRTVTITGPADLVNKVSVRQQKGTISFGCTDRITPQNFNKVKVYVNWPGITDFEASSGGSIQINGTIGASNKKMEFEASSGAYISASGVTASKLDVGASSGALITIFAINAKSVEAEVSSGASASLAGTATTVEFEASSGGSLNASKLAARDGSAEANSGGSVKCHVTGNFRTGKSYSGTVTNK